MVRSVNKACAFRCSLAVCISLFVATPGFAAEPLLRAHAHNDYWHERPLLDALDRGFCSVEADVFLVEGQLLVGHDRGELRSEGTLRKLYLDPLRERCESNHGRVFDGGPTFTLLVDIKENGVEAYRVLERTLDEYRQWLCRIEAGAYQEGAIQVVVSGDRPLQVMLGQADRLAFYDGRLSDLGSDLPPSLMPLISDRWANHFAWNGGGEFPDDQRQRLREIVARAHMEGRRVRFWATPERESMWQELVAAEVDHINTDRLKALESFLRQ